MSEQTPEAPIERHSGRPVLGPMPDPLAALSRGRAEGQAEDPTVTEMKKNRRVNARRTGSLAGSPVTFATGRPRDPMFYWKQNNLPYDVNQPGELQKVRDYCRTLYQTHPIIGSATDVYTKYPLTGMELRCKDEQLTDFYSTLFFEQLNYEEFLPEVGREYWTVGEAWPLGTWNDLLGVWESDELIKPEDVEVIRSPFLKEPRLQMKIPEVIRQILTDRAPAWEFQQLITNYPELKNFIGNDARMPVSNILLKQIAYKADTFHPRGIPLLLRGLRAVMQEEMLNAAQDAIASRLYTPLILAKLGASATDLGTNAPWIPTEDDLEAFQESLDAALTADFRVLTHHFALDMSSVFGRETMPNLDADFERLTDRMLQVYGLSRTMLTGAEAGATYASDSINRDLVSQLLTGYQKKIKRFFRERALVVAEAQEHFDYEVRGGIRYPIMEEVLVVGEDGRSRIVEQPKLLVPDLHIKAMTMKDETDQRQFIEALRASGVPISMRTRMMNSPVDLDEEIDISRDEQVRLAVEAQETRKATYQALRDKGLPIPDDLIQDFQAKAMGAEPPQQAATPAGQQVLPSVGTETVNGVALAPTPEEQAAAVSTQNVAEGLPAPGAAPDNVVRLPRPKADSARPPESDEQRATMPKPASLVAVDADDRQFTEYLATVRSDDEETPDRQEWRQVNLEEDSGASNLLSGPRHVGSRSRRPMRALDGSLLPLPD